MNTMAPTLLIAGLLTTAVAVAQTPEAEVRQVEQARIDAAHAGRSLASFNADDYFDIIPPGTTRTKKDLSAGAGTPQPNAYASPDLKIRVLGSVAVVTGTLGGPGSGGARDRILRVWVKQGGKWQSVGYHGTWIGKRDTANPELLLPAPAASSFRAKDATEQAIWAVHEGIEQASQNSDAARYRQLTTSDFVRVIETGEARTLDEWVGGFSGQKRPPSVQSDVRLRVFGDVALMTYRNFGRVEGGANRPHMLMTRIFLRQGGQWKLMYTQSTIARKPA